MTGKEFLDEIKGMIEEHGVDEEYSLGDLLDDAATLGMDGASEHYQRLFKETLKLKGQTDGSN